MSNFTYSLTFAQIPFIADMATAVRMKSPSYDPEQDENLSPIKDQQRTLDLLDEIDRVMPFDWLQDFEFPTGPGGRRTNALASWSQAIQDPIHINTWYYPNSLSRWSIFRALATESMYQAMLNESDDQNTADLEMTCVPIGPSNSNPSAASDGISSSMYLFLGRPVYKTQTKYDGLFLLTFVDERYFFAGTPVPELTINQNTTWQNIIDTCAEALGIEITNISNNPVNPAYGQPEADSQFWSMYESAPTLLDAIALNLGQVIVRQLDGSYVMMDPLQSKAVVEENRGNASTVTRLMGGNIFSTTNAIVREAVIPANIHVCFPQYALSPVPHFINGRYSNQRPSCWYEDGYGGIFPVTVPIASGPPLTSGLTGISDMTVMNTAKALQTLESDSSPLNVSGLTNLALQITTDIWNYKLAAALDETYPGIVDWQPDGLHDIVWTYSSKNRVAGTRVLRGSWNNDIHDMSHSTPIISGMSNTPAGVGGPSVAQTWRDSFSGSASTTLGTLMSGQASVSFTAIDNFPTQNRWKGIINSGQTDQEICLFEGTSGGTSVGIAQRGIDGTVAQNHGGGSVNVSWLTPDTQYGANLITFEKGQFVAPGMQTSGGLAEAVVIPQTQSIQCLNNNTIGLNGIRCASGQLLLFDTVSGAFNPLETVWIVERNSGSLTSGRIYDGMYAGISPSGTVAPLYLVTEYPQKNASGTITSGYAAGYYNSGHFPSGTIAVILSGTIGITDIGSGGVVSGAIGNGAVVSGSIASGSVWNTHLASGIITSGFWIGSGSIEGTNSSGNHIASGTVGTWDIGNAQIRSGNIASGNVSAFHIASGTILGYSGVVVEYEPATSGHSGSIMISVSGITGGGGNNSGLYGKQSTIQTVTSGTTYTNYQIPETPALYISGSTAAVFAGLVVSGGGQPPDGRRIYIFNVGSGTITINGTTGYGNTIYPGQSGASNTSGITIRPNQGTWLEYSRSTNSGVGSWQPENYYPILSGDLGSGMLGLGSVNSGNVSSGAIGPFQIMSGAITGQSGVQVSYNSSGIQFAVASGGIKANDISSGSYIGQSGVSVDFTFAVSSGEILFYLASGGVQSNNIGSGAIQSGALSSGSIGNPNAFGSGVIGSGALGNGAVNSGNISSGTIPQPAGITLNSGLVTTAFSEIFKVTNANGLNGCVSVRYIPLFGNLGYTVTYTDARGGVYTGIQHNLSLAGTDNATISFDDNLQVSGICPPYTTISISGTASTSSQATWNTQSNLG